MLWIRLLLAATRHGLPAVKQAIAGGQHAYPHGLFYGGKGPCKMQRILGERLGPLVGQASEVLHLDFHTGLGKWCTYQLVADRPVVPARARWLQDSFGAEYVPTIAASSSIPYCVRGSFGGWCHHHLAGKSYHYLCAEFGTYGVLAVLQALRAENQFQHWSNDRGNLDHWSKKRMREVFCPGSRQWRQSVIRQATMVVDQGFHALAGVAESQSDWARRLPR